MIRPITISELALFDIPIPEAVIKGWIETFNQRRHPQDVELQQEYKLTDLQSHVLGNLDTFDETKNLLVAGPTSSGKTLIAEAIIAATLARNPKAKILYLVPLKALVREKWEQFKSVFEDQNIVRQGSVIPLSSDYPSSDHLIARSNWNIAVIVFDKLYRWLTDKERLTELTTEVELVIVDEVQVIESEVRGEKLEVILSILLWLQEKKAHLGYSRKPRIVAIMASDTVENETVKQLQKWLNATIVPKPNLYVSRPVQLYEGWIVPSSRSYDLWTPFEEELEERKLVIFSNLLRRNILEYESCPSLLREVLSNLTPAGDADRLAIYLSEHFVNQGLRVLIYVAKKSAAEEMARRVRKNFLTHTQFNKIHPRIASQLDELEDSYVKDILSSTLQAHVGFHHGGMSAVERELVEEGFRQPGNDPPICVVVATPTLSMGVNLPADIVLMRDQHTYKKSSTSTNSASENHYEFLPPGVSEQKLSTLAYRNFAGRAGRYRSDLPQDAFGLTLLLLEDEKQTVIHELLYGVLKPLISQLHQPMYGYHPHMLVILAAIAFSRIKGVTITEETVFEVLEKSYTFSIDQSAQKLKKDVHAALADLEKLNLLDSIESRLELNGIGKAVASHCLSLDSIKELLALVDALPDLWPRYPLDILYRLSELPEVQEEYPTIADLPEESDKREEIEKHVKVFLRGISHLYSNSPSSPFRVFFQEETDSQIEESLKIIRTILLWEWLKGKPVTQLEKLRKTLFPNLYSGALKKLAERVSFCINALRCLYSQHTLDYNTTTFRQLWLFEHALRYGVPLEVVPIPVTVSYASNKRLISASCMKVVSLAGFKNDARTLIGKPAPPELSLKIWETVQEGLRWWVEVSRELGVDPANSSGQVLHAFQTGNEEGTLKDEFSLMLYTLEDLSKGLYAKDLELFAGYTLGGQELAGTALDKSIYHMILTRVRQRMKEYALQQYDELRRLTLSSFEKAPLSIKLKVRTIFPNLSVLEMDDYWRITIFLIPGRPRSQSFKILPNKSRLIVICSEAPDEEVQLPKKSGLLLTIEALVAASEFIGDRPSYRSQLLNLLSTYQGRIDSTKAMLDLITSING